MRVSRCASREREAHHAEATDGDAVDAERRQALRLEVADEEARREVRGDRGNDRTDERLTPNAVTEMPGEVGDLVDARAENDGRREQEREPGRVFVVETTHETADHRDAGATDAGEQRSDLREADEQRFPVGERFDASAARETVAAVARAGRDASRATSLRRAGSRR